MRGHDQIIALRKQRLAPEIVFVNDFPCQTDWYELGDFPTISTAGDKIEYLDLRFLINLTVSICSPTEERAKTLFEAVKAAGATTVAATHAKAVLWASQADGWAIIWRKP